MRPNPNIYPTLYVNCKETEMYSLACFYDFPCPAPHIFPVQSTSSSATSELVFKPINKNLKKVYSKLKLKVDNLVSQRRGRNDKLLINN
ncbi:hypothetical protein CONCODRAFT_7398 [Conidiobolus coronatus NRRL 28638]|uniref:Uncharacterized protein n=1 Tax=Conidiobolus coronatus (strain ATCC 28846 / CBS 209.66 / NRRL 28638) TaxID=796925 RepID=A0A137P4X1_CONC2|nr:hypothetical protein CONCODRAFT_7398 [Conidiobolus coronatus NRRL 28638]|eukprot:KXN70067.1 hypothetical protein CONCODRAFT_7398 [Conidiobolus coronatus NRRL 28638]